MMLGGCESASEFRFATLDDYFRAFLPSDHPCFSTDGSAAHRLGEALRERGADPERAPDDFVAHWLRAEPSDLAAYGSPREVLKTVGANRARRVRCAVKFELPGTFARLSFVALAERPAYQFVADRSPRAFTMVLCRRFGLSAKLTEGLDLRRLCAGADMLISPSWRNEPRFGLLLVSIDGHV